MRVALVIDHFSPVGGVTARTAGRIARRLIEGGHAVTLIAGGCHADHHLPGAEMVVLARRRPLSTWRLLKFAAWARRKLARGKFDVSLAMTPLVPADVVYPVGGTIRARCQQTVAAQPTSRGRWGQRFNFVLRPRHQVARAIERRTFRSPQTHTILASNNYVADLLPRRVQRIVPGVESPQVTPAQCQHWREQLRAAFGVPEDICAFLFVACDRRLDGFEALLAALARLRQQAAPAVLWVAGPIDYAQHAAAVRYGVRDRLRFLGPSEQMSAVYAAADVTVQSGSYDPSGQTVLESLALGTPAISSRFSGGREWIDPAPGPRRGIVVAEPANERLLAEAMQRLTEPATLEACRLACDGLAAEISMKRHVDELLTVLSEAASRARPRNG